MFYNVFIIIITTKNDYNIYIFTSSAVGYIFKNFILKNISILIQYFKF